MINQQWRILKMDDVLRDDLRKIFNRHNPVGVYEDDETNYDEYDSEINHIPKLFQESKNLDEFTLKIHKLFIDYFGKLTGGNKSKYLELSKELYKFLKESSSNKNLKKITKSDY
jgi:hypothetical protein